MAIYNPVNVAKVVSGVDEEVARILRDGVTAEELKRAKDGYLKQLEVIRTNDNMLASSLAENLFIGRTMQFDADLEARSRSDRRGGQRRPAQVHPPRAAFRRHGGRFQGNEVVAPEQWRVASEESQDEDRPVAGQDVPFLATRHSKPATRNSNSCNLALGSRQPPRRMVS